jgi:predicted ATPase
MSRQLSRIQVEGYKSIAKCDLPLRPLNVVVGPNGAGKSNLIQAFGLLGSIVNATLQLSVARAGGASTVLHGGPKRTARLRLHTFFGANQYEAVLVPAANDDLVFERETCYFHGPGHVAPYDEVIGAGTRESNLPQAAKERPGKVPAYCYEAMRSWRVFHFHDNADLRADGANVAPFLYRLRATAPDHYRRIVDSIRLVAPFFEDFNLRPDRVNEGRIQLEWRQVGSDQYFNAHALSDGTLRFILLSTLLLQPEPPSVVVIDEPELGLHPFAITQLSDMLRATSVGHQVIVATQSVTLLNQLEAGDVIVVEQHDGSSSFTRPEPPALEAWLGEYALGELWEKNVLGGRPY